MNRNAVFFVLIPLLLVAGCGHKKKESPVSQVGESCAPPKVLPSVIKVKRKSKTYVITGIGTRGTNAVAIINGEVLSPGMEIDPGVVLKRVCPTYAAISVDGSEYLLRPEDIQKEQDKKAAEASNSK